MQLTVSENKEHILTRLYPKATNSPPNCPFPFDDHHQNQIHPIPSPTPFTTPSGIRIQSAVLPQYRCADRQTRDDMVNHNSALLSYSDSERRAENESVTSVKFGSSAGASNATELSASGGGLCPCSRRGFCLVDPCWGLCPQTPIYRLTMTRA